MPVPARARVSAPQVVIPVVSVQLIKKHKTARLLPNGLAITTNASRKVTPAAPRAAVAGPDTTEGCPGPSSLEFGSGERSDPAESTGRLGSERCPCAAARQGGRRRFAFVSEFLGEAKPK